LLRAGRDLAGSYRSTHRSRACATNLGWPAWFAPRVAN
jgi:hypothetical protein